MTVNGLVFVDGLMAVVVLVRDHGGGGEVIVHGVGERRNKSSE